MKTKFTVMDNSSLRNLCIEKNWFTNGDIEQYERLFELNRNNSDILIIATVIWICSKNYTIDEVLNILKEENTRYFS